MQTAIVQLHRGAPPKPPMGEPCNGCGLCCATEPCPIGTVTSLRRRGRCTALEWHEADARYRCGLLVRAGDSGRAAQRLVSRWIAAGQGCDASLEPLAAETLGEAEAADA